jgi:hypothetical protein
VVHTGLSRESGNQNHPVDPPKGPQVSFATESSGHKPPFFIYIAAQVPLAAALWRQRRFPEQLMVVPVQHDCPSVPQGSQVALLPMLTAIQLAPEAEQTDPGVQHACPRPPQVPPQDPSTMQVPAVDPHDSPIATQAAQLELSGQFGPLLELDPARQQPPLQTLPGQQAAPGTPHLRQRESVPS